jgi:radical SAM-linked protein
MHFNVNVGTFIPKPHTPYQWVPQIDENTARAKIEYIRNKLKPQGHKVGINDPFIALIEGVLSRGDERVGELIETAYTKGCRLDAWDEYIKKDVWAELLAANAALVGGCIGARVPEAPLPWECIQSGSTVSFLKRELKKSDTEEITSPCIKNCINPCGICDKNKQVVYNNIHNDKLLYDKIPLIIDPGFSTKQDPLTVRVLFSFEKTGTAAFLPHLGLVESFSMAFTRAGIPVLYTRGFNPLPRLDFASPLSLGISADAEIASVDLRPDPGQNFESTEFIRLMNTALAAGLIIKDALKIFIPTGAKKHSIQSLLWGFLYAAPGESETAVPAREEKKFRQLKIETGIPIYSLRRKAVLAKQTQNPDQMESYFAVYQKLYNTNNEGNTV